MKVYCQFLHLSTGYINGSIPPQFREDNKKPIEACGNDSVYVLDARKGINTMRSECLSVMKQRKYIGFKIIRANSFRDKGAILTNYIVPGMIK